MEKSNAVKLAAVLVRRLEKLYVPPIAAEFRDYFGKSYTGICNDYGSVLCSPRGVKIVPEGEEGMDLTWSKFIKFCHENGLMEEKSTSCDPTTAPSRGAAASLSASAATNSSSMDAAPSTSGSSTVLTPPSGQGPGCPAACGTAAPLEPAQPASAAMAAFDYSGLDLPTVDTLHWALGRARNLRCPAGLCSPAGSGGVHCARCPVWWRMRQFVASSQ